MAKTVRVSIVVLCYNGLEETTRPCLESIIANTLESESELIIVDNGSVDGTVEYLKMFASCHANVRIHLNDRNKGYAGGNNDGIKLAKGRFIVLLNNDTLVPAGWLDRLLKLFHEQSSVGLIGPVTNSAGNEQRIELEGLNERNFENVAEAYIQRQQGSWYSVEKLGFFCVAIRRQVLDKIGFLDENFGIGMFEDDDYCARVRKGGFTIAVAEDCFVYHKGSVSFGKLAMERYRELFEKNKAYFRQKHGLEWTLTSIAFSYWNKFNQDLMAHVKNNKKITSELERVLIRAENFKHLLMQIYRVELASIPNHICAVSSPPIITLSKWKKRWIYFKRQVLQGTFDEKRNYLFSLLERILQLFISESNRPVSDAELEILPIPVPEVVLYQLNAIHASLCGKKLIIFPATIDFHYMTQRPQHLARAFTEAGYVVIYGTLNRQMDKVDITERVTDSLYLMNELHFIYLKYVFNAAESIYYCLWPNNAKHLEYLPYSYLLYDYMDELSLLDLPESELERDHQMMINQANLVTVSADKLMKQLPTEILPKTLLVNNAVSHEFIEAVNADELNSRNLNVLSEHVVLGYYGAIAQWLDFDLIEHLAETFREARIVLIGPVMEGVSKRVTDLLWKHTNIVVLPACKQLELVSFLNRFNVCLLPFIKNTVTDAVSPVKLFEYFSAGKPVVTTNIVECAKYAPAHIANDHGEFVNLIRKILLVNSKNPDETAQQIALNNTWCQRVQDINLMIKVGSMT